MIVVMNGDMDADKGIAIITEVLNGNRVLLNDVTEHDSLSDIRWLNVNGKKITGNGIYNKDNYIPDVTIIHNKYEDAGEAGFVFYTFAPGSHGSSGDPFGYKKNYRESIDEKTV
ncbi:MAG: hypothetical protein IJ068_01780 [Bacilli bacterium]|nr:hypothetical protein [Bacilli bacterium]